MKAIRLLCGECGAVRMRTPSGTVCPNGHGRLHPKASSNQIKTALRYRWALSFPLAEKEGRTWKIGGEGKYKPAKFDPSSKNPYHVPTGVKGNDLAVSIGKKIVVRRYVPA